MPGHIVLPPKLVDQSFPRDARELKEISSCIGAIADICDAGSATVLLTDLFLDYLDNFEWQQGEDGLALLNDIYVTLNMFATRSGSISHIVVLSEIPEATPHPLPTHYDNSGICDLWQSDTGRLLVLHDRVHTGPGFFIGVACDQAFLLADRGPVQCRAERSFPFVGPKQLADLLDSFDWVIPDGSINAQITFSMAYRNVFALGATEIKDPPGSSHYKVKFPNAPRPWPLDPNVDPVPQRFLHQLVEITGYPEPVIYFALIHGCLPKKKQRLQNFLLEERS